MFTGLIEEVGTVTAIYKENLSATFTIRAEKIAPEVKVGDSISVNGVCLTVVTKAPAGQPWFKALAMSETLSRSTLGSFTPGRKVNLERALRLDSRLDGHLVLGHVDGVGQVVAIEAEGAARLVTVTASASLMAGMVFKGSVALDGVSLTIARLTGNSFSVALIPHTMQVTTLGALRPGEAVNLETDIIGKYVAGYMQKRSESSGLTMELLQREGFV
ncbi:MAG TPA: riboflavin synthase [Firmicutes bacterium]|nr:riboflavin synthase [Bacillota bacterium]